MSEVDARTWNYQEAQDRMSLLPAYYGWTYRRIIPFLKGTVVELGCGAGHGISLYLDRVDHVFAVDHDRTLLKRITKRWPPPSRVTPIVADLRFDWSKLSEIEADAVVMMDLLEHFESDRDFLRRAAGLLKPGGHLALKVPAQTALYSLMDMASGHFRRYEAADLRLLAAAANLEIVLVRQINPLGAWVYKLKRNSQKTNFSRTFRPWQLRVINRLIPALAWLDHFSGLNGLSLIAVLRK